MSEEEIIAFMEQQERRRQENEECRQLAIEILKEKPTIVPLWHLQLEGVDLELQGDTLDEKYTDQGYSIIPDLNILHLFSKLKLGDQNIFLSDKDIFSNGEFDEFSFCRIVKLWKNNLPVIPPTITIPEGLDCLFAQDGKHRLKLAYYFDAQTVPILIPTKQMEMIVALLK